MITLKTMTNLATRTLAYARKHGKTVMPVIAAMEKSGLCGLTNAYVNDADFTVSIIGGARELGNAWHILRTAGFGCSSDRPEANASLWGGWFRLTDATTGERVTIHLAFSSTVCTRVQVGTKTVDIPVYETRCGEDVQS